MSHRQILKELNGNALEKNTAAEPSLKRASILFVASLGTFIGTSILLATIGQN